MFRWTKPIPPSCAIAIAMRASVTVSIAADTSGMFRRIRRDRRVETSASRGTTALAAGTSSTSSKVSPSASSRTSMTTSRSTKAPSRAANGAFNRVSYGAS